MWPLSLRGGAPLAGGFEEEEGAGHERGEFFQVHVNSWGFERQLLTNVCWVTENTGPLCEGTPLTVMAGIAVRTFSGPGAAT